jgi:hypothetical protein
MSATTDRIVVGLEPWLPWPLKAWGWWRQSVRAERLAALRIGMAACLLIDLLTTYGPHLPDYFGTGGLGGSQMFAYYGEAPRLNWSLLRGFGDPLLGTLALATWTVLTIWIALDFLGRLAARDKQHMPRRYGLSIILWLASAALVVLGVWSRSSKEAGESHRLLLSWQDDPTLLSCAFWTWVAATVLLMTGFWTRMAAILTWALSMSFANINPNIDNAGDTIRGITLFYLMLCPCGAAWSIDRFIQRRRQGTTAPAYVWPWALRLLFMQLILIYFVNGLYKVTGANWLAGDSLYYVLCDLTLTRFSIAQLPMPFVVAQISTWLVLAWELSFPILVLFRWTRYLALWIGVAFHLGILATMELGGFVPYVLCLYLPLLPWERWVESASGATHKLRVKVPKNDIAGTPPTPPPVDNTP